MYKPTYIYVDGSYGRNANGTSGGIGIFYADNDKRNMSIAVKASNIKKFDNQAMECLGVYLVLSLTSSINNIIILSDCQHVVDALTVSYDRFVKSHWLTTKNAPVAHRDILENSGIVLNKRRLGGDQISILRIQGHSGFHGNEMADKFAYAAMTDHNDTRSVDALKLTLFCNSNFCNVVADTTRFPLLKQIVTENSMVSMSSSEVCNSTDNDLAIQTDILNYDTILLGLANKSKPDNVATDTTVDGITEGVVEDTDLSLASVPSGSVENKKQLSIGDTLVYDETNASLFYVCVQCITLLEVIYPRKINKKAMKQIAEVGICTIACTTCKDCIAKSTNATTYYDAANVAETYNTSMQHVRLSPLLFKNSTIYNCAEVITGLTPTILIESNAVRYIPVDSISKMCNKTCVVRSIDLDNQLRLDCLKFGFLL